MDPRPEDVAADLDGGDSTEPRSRDASVVLAAGAGSAGPAAAELMDPANQSLANALKISYRVVNFAMIILVVLFLFSGFQQVQEGERGITLIFGAPTGDALTPGLHPAPPYPIGEMVRVPTGTETAEMLGDFWPNGLNPRTDLTAPVSRIGKTGNINPLNSGSVITADLNLAHMQLRVTYSVTDPEAFARGVYESPADPLTGLSDQTARRFVQSAVRRATVLTVAERSIDDILKPQDTGEIPRLIQERAQAMLDTVGSGIEVDVPQVVRRIPPPDLVDQFNAVQAARSETSRALEKATTERNTILSSTAGPAAQALLAMIDRFEEAIGDPDEAEAVLAEIDAALEGGPIDDQGLEVRVVGEVTQILSNARNEANARRESALAKLRIFEAKLEQFNANPLLTVQREWSGAYREFRGKEFVQFMQAGPGGRVRVEINPHPTAELNAETEAKRAQARRAAERRLQLQNGQR